MKKPWRTVCADQPAGTPLTVTSIFPKRSGYRLLGWLTNKHATAGVTYKYVILFHNWEIFETTGSIEFRLRKI